MFLPYYVSLLLILSGFCATETEIDCKQNPETGNCFIGLGSSNEKPAEEAENICSARNSSIPVLMYPSDTRFIRNTINYEKYRVGLRRNSLDCNKQGQPIKNFAVSLINLL